MTVRARLIYNPSSGREEIKRRLPAILQRLEQGGIETSTHATSGPGDAMAAAAEAADRGFDMIIAAGGDGTLYEVVNGLAPKPTRPRLGIIPLGTTNDFARALGIPKYWEYACDLIVQQYTRGFDVGMANDRCFINISGGGYLTELTYEVPTKLKTMIGQLAYYLKGLEKLPRLRPIELDIRSPHYNGTVEAMMFLVCNSNSVGGFERLAPSASLSDGLLDVLVLKRCHLADFLRAATMALRGEHLFDPNVIYFQTDEMTITSEDMVQLNLDGELGGALPVTYKVLTRHLDIIVDETGESTYQ